MSCFSFVYCLQIKNDMFCLFTKFVKQNQNTRKGKDCKCGFVFSFFFFYNIQSFEKAKKKKLNILWNYKGIPETVKEENITSNSYILS